MNDDHLVAFHEAAHGVIGVMSGMSVRAIVLHHSDPRLDERGRCDLWNWAEDRDADPTRFLIFTLAGASAERRASGSYSMRDRDDRHYARLFAAITLKLEPDDPRVDAHLTGVQRIADARMANDLTWSWIERVARELVRRRRMTGRDIEWLRPVGPEARR